MIAPVVSMGAVSGLVGVATAGRLGFRSGSGTTVAFATLLAGFATFAATCLARDLVACDLAASGPGARSSGTNNAQDTKSDTVALVCFILVDRSGFAIPPK
jgi:hypothetical protein